MKNQTNFNNTTEITAEACAWMAQLNSGELTCADELALKEWIQRSPRHASELKNIANLSKDINILTDMNDSIDCAVQKQHSIKRSTKINTRWGSRITVVSLSLAFVVGILIFNVHSPSVIQPLLISTAVGEFKQVELSDGTVVKINTNSKLAINYTDKVRRVRLLAGEALFDVKHNPQRPFLVYADEQFVRAVGTAFTVSLLKDTLSVTVVEGKVEFAKLASPKINQIDSNSKTPLVNQPISPVRSIFLEVGQQIEISANKPVAVVKDVPDNDLQRELSWQYELFDFSDTPLKEVINELSRYSSMKVEIVDSSLFNIKFGGIFRTNDTKPLFDALSSTYNVKVKYLNKNHVQLSKVN